MTRHQKRLSVSKPWSVERKTGTLTAKTGAGLHGGEGVPLLIVLRDVLGYMNSKKEAQYALNHQNILVNGGVASDVHYPIGMFDILAFVQREEYYRVSSDERGRLVLTPINADSASSRLGKIVNKTQVGGGDFQLTPHDGATLVVEDASEYSGKDSIVVDNEMKDVATHFPYEEGTSVTAINGRHTGEIGEVTEIIVTSGSGNNSVVVETEGGESETVEQYVVIIDESFMGLDDKPETCQAADGSDDE